MKIAIALLLLTASCSRPHARYVSPPCFDIERPIGEDCCACEPSDAECTPCVSADGGR